MSMLGTLLEPGRREKAAEDQLKLSQVMGPRVARLPAQSKYLYGVARERIALDQIGQVEGADASTQPALFNQLAEGLALQAKFEAAAAVAPEGAHKDEYLAKAAAVALINEQQCEHEASRPIVSLGPRAGLSAEALREHPDAAPAVAARQEATQLLMEKIFNGKVVITFTRCIICGAISAYA
jgi:hypothetical protein